MAGISTATSLCTANVNLLTLISTRLLLPLIFANDTVTQADAQRPAEATPHLWYRERESPVTVTQISQSENRSSSMISLLKTYLLCPTWQQPFAGTPNPTPFLPSSKLPPPYTNPHFLTVQCGHTPLLPPSNPPPPQ